MGHQRASSLGSNRAGKGEKGEGSLADIVALNAKKISRLLLSENKLRCENESLRRADDERLRVTDASQRGTAFVKAEATLLQQDAKIRALYEHLGKADARAVIFATLEAGPKRMRAVTREELRWRLEDVRAEIAEVESNLKNLPDALEESQASSSVDNDETFTKLKEAVEAASVEVQDLQTVKNGLQVELLSLERQLAENLKRLVGVAIDPSSRLRSAVLGRGPAAEEKSRLDQQERDFVRLSEHREALEEGLTKREESLAKLRQTLKEEAAELSKARAGAVDKERDVAISFQSELMAEQRRRRNFDERLGELQREMAKLRKDLRKEGPTSARRLHGLRQDLQRDRSLEAKQSLEEGKKRQATTEAKGLDLLKDLEEQRKRAETKCRVTQSENEEAEKELDRLRTSTKHFEAEVASAQQEREHWQQRVETLQQDLAAAAALCNPLLAERRDLVDAEMTLQQEADERKAVLEQREGKLSQLQAQRRELQARRDLVSEGALELLASELRFAEAATSRHTAALTREIDEERQMLKKQESHLAAAGYHVPSFNLSLKTAAPTDAAAAGAGAAEAAPPLPAPAVGPNESVSASASLLASEGSGNAELRLGCRVVVGEGLGEIGVELQRLRKELAIGRSLLSKAKELKELDAQEASLEPTLLELEDEKRRLEEQLRAAQFTICRLSTGCPRCIGNRQ